MSLFKALEKSMPKLIMFMDSPVVPTGYASTCRLTAKEMAKRGWDMYALAFNGGPQGDKPFDWFGIKVLPNYAIKKDPNNIYGDLDTVIRLYNEIKPDILFFHNDSYRYPYIKDLPQHILDRTVFWLPFEGDMEDPVGRMLFPKCAATRFVTNHALKIHEPLLKGKNFGFIPHAVDLESFVPPANKIDVKRSCNKGFENKFVVARVDRHQPRKYWNLAIEAFGKFAEGKEDVYFIAKCNPRDCVMYDEKKKTGIDLEALAVQNGLGSYVMKDGKPCFSSNKIEFTDFFFNNEFLAKAIYQPADVFLTTTSGEGFGLCVVEAMACGVPVIYPDTPVLPEVVGDDGLQCRLKGRQWYEPMQVFHNIVDTDSVVEKLENAYVDWRNGGMNLADMGMRSRAKVEQKYSPKSVYDEWDRVFRDVSENHELASLITVIYNISGDEQIDGEDGVEKLRQSLEKHVKHPYEWIVVDNGSPEREKTRKWMEAAAKGNPRIKPVYLDDNLGFGGGNNVAISQAKGQYVILTNPDCEALDPKKLNLPGDFVRMFVSKAKQDPRIGIVGMEINRRDDIMPGSMFPYFCNILVTKKCLDACKIDDDKWFDEKFFPAYYEDADLVFRAMGKGFKVVEENVPFWHKSGGTNKHAIKGGKDGPAVKYLRDSIEKMAVARPKMADFERKRGELIVDGMQGLIQGNIKYLNSKWGMSARQKIKVVFDTHIGAAVGFSEIAEGLIPELHRLGFDVYVNDWSNGANIQDPLIREIYEKTRKVNAESDDLESAIHVVCWLMESFNDVDADYKVGISLCESTKVRPQYLATCNGMDRILTFSEFCRTVQINSGYTVPIDVIPPGIHPIFLNYHERKISDDKFTFLSVGVSQERKDTRRLVEAFCEAFPKNAEYFPECEPGLKIRPGQVELVLKSNNFGELNWVRNGGYMDRANVRPIFTGWDSRAERKDFSRQEMYDLYLSADCLVHPSHGEGVGYPLLEAAGTGLPIIFTNWSSPAEYFNESNSYPCCLGPNGTDFSDAYPGAGIPGENGKWANIHIGHMKHQMRHVIRNREEAREKGKRAAADMATKYTWTECARHLIPMLFEWDAERKRKTAKTHFDPLTFEKPKLEPIKEGDRVLLDICSRDRQPYLCTLIVSLLGQTFKNWDVLIECDDVDESMPNNYQLLSMLARGLHEGHSWRIIRSHRQGPHAAHERTLQMAANDPKQPYKLVCRIDDDIWVKADYLENLFKVFLQDPNTAAVGGVYLDPKRSDADQAPPAGWQTDINYAGKIDHNVPWPYICKYPEGTPIRPVEHLYSSFMYRVEAAVAIGGYCKRFSQIGHREESDFSYRFHLGGWKQYIQPKAMGFHFQAPAGGIRSDAITEKNKLAEGDDKMYRRRLAKWKKRAEMRKQQDAEKQPAPKLKSGKLLTVINGDDIETIRKAIEHHSPWSDEIYVTCQDAKGKAALGGIEKVRMVATSPDETAMLTKALLADGDHEFILTVSAGMRFQGNPESLISNDYDDYVFEVYRAYECAETTAIRPEVENKCLLMRRRADAQPNMERILYSDMAVRVTERKFCSDLATVIKDRLIPGVTSDKDLLPVDQLENRHWRKVCVYQYPEGRLEKPRYLDMVPTSSLVSIVIPTISRRDLLKKCISSIYAHTTTPFELIIVDNGSTDGTAEYLKAEAELRPTLRSIRMIENVGYQKATNIGIAAAKGKYVLLFNDDAWVEGREPDGRDWLQVYVDALESDPKIGLVGPHGGISPALGNRILYFWCVMFRKSLFEKVGPLDDVTFFNYGGDDDYCERIRRAGYSIKEVLTKLRHLMNCVPENVKKKELSESVVRLKAKYLK
jgi:GT2 family glycosyltransferase/glycosyltransferase involved in cell wall biosynthesis